MENPELACVYAALILLDDDVAITGDKIMAVLRAANVKVEPFWPGLFAKALEGVDIRGLIANIGSGVGSGGPTSASAAATAAATADPVESQAAPAKEVPKKEEPKEESDDDMGFGLFD